MEIVICKTREEASKLAAKAIIDQVKAKPKSVLGLATGSTPVLMYKELGKAVKAKKVSFREVKSWNLDEYYGLAPTHDQSYRYFMNENLFKFIDINIKNTHVLNGLAKDPVKECKAYEAAIKRAGGIDLQVLGIGSDGHIAFNEPGTSLASRTSVVYLTPSTIKDNARLFFKGKMDEVPTRALSMGVGTICEAKKIILLAFGEGKQDAVKGMVEGGVSQFCTASALQMHPDAWVYCDEAAAKKLKLKYYYAWRSATKLGL
ncbi:MAG: glucosamine-6-phosphate deaminase [Kiritimatiellae bacterium]|nr:glucosamine-6-phosphate deaminase [Kiritimatiellia bacterium]